MQSSLSLNKKKKVIRDFNRLNGEISKFIGKYEKCPKLYLTVHAHSIGSLLDVKIVPQFLPDSFEE